MIVKENSYNSFCKKSPKEILSILLKQSLDVKLMKMEQKNLNDKNILFSIKETSNKMNKFLEDSLKRSKYNLILIIEILYSE